MSGGSGREGHCGQYVGDRRESGVFLQSGRWLSWEKVDQKGLPALEQANLPSPDFQTVKLQSQLPVTPVNSSSRITDIKAFTKHDVALS